MLIVQKYGGTSLHTPKHIREAATRIESLKKQGHSLVVVVSAMGHTTDHLIKIAKKTVASPPARELDMLLTAGERISMSLLAMSLAELGVQAISFTGSQSGIITDNNHTQAKILEIRPLRIQEELQKGKVVIVAGFQGVSREKEITTLGRGGSDTTAVALASALKADVCEVLTDVDGIFTADPRIVTRAKLISNCSYELALEMAILGAKMHPRSLELAKTHQVSLRICSSKNKDCNGTLISKDAKEDSMESAKITGIPTKDGFHFFRVPGSLNEVTQILATKGIEPQFLQWKDKEVCFLVDETQVQTVRNGCKNFKEIENLSIVSVVGEGVSHSKEVASVFLQTVEELKTECVLFTTGSLSLTAAVPKGQKKNLAERLHQKFLETP